MRIVVLMSEAEMSEDLMRYDLLIENALRDVVRQTLNRVIRDGLPGEHHFYITFQTDYQGVEIPDYLRKQYDGEMTIVLQYQFFGLKVEPDGFSVMLSFNNVREKLVVPFAAITTFADPSVNFALQFQSSHDARDEESSAATKTGGESPNAEKPKDEKRGEVISLDKFRKR